MTLRISSVLGRPPGLAAGKKLRRIWVDGTYRGKLVNWVSEHYQFLLQPVLRSDDLKGFVVLPRRWVVERTLCPEGAR